MTNYHALEVFDDPVERGNQLLGAPSNWWFTSTYSETNMYTLLGQYQVAGNIMTAYCNNSVTGLNAGFYYSILGVFNLSNNVKVIKLRDQNGIYATEWSGAYNDSDPIWSTISTTSKTAVKYARTNDGVFFMTITDFKKNFQWVMYTFNPATWKHAYWMALGDGDTIGTPGVSS